MRRIILLALLAPSVAVLALSAADDARHAKLLRMQSLLQQELDELEARRELAALEGILADESTAIMPPAGPTVDLVMLSDDADVGASNASRDDSTTPGIETAPVVGDTPAANEPPAPKDNAMDWVRSYRHGRAFAGTHMPYPLPSGMAGVVSYVRGCMHADDRDSSTNTTTGRGGLAVRMARFNASRLAVRRKERDQLRAAVAARNAVPTSTTTQPATAPQNYSQTAEVAERSLRRGTERRTRARHLMRRLANLREARAIASVPGNAATKGNATMIGDPAAAQATNTARPATTVPTAAADVPAAENKPVVLQPAAVGSHGDNLPSAAGAAWAWTVLLWGAPVALVAGVCVGYCLPLDVISSAVRRKSATYVEITAGGCGSGAGAGSGTGGVYGLPPMFGSCGELRSRVGVRRCSKTTLPI